MRARRPRSQDEVALGFQVEGYSGMLQMRAQSINAIMSALSLQFVIYF